jgi:sulfur carrier protein ThiS
MTSSARRQANPREPFGKPWLCPSKSDNSPAYGKESSVDESLKVAALVTQSRQRPGAVLAKVETPIWSRARCAPHTLKELVSLQ